MSQEKSNQKNWKLITSLLIVAFFVLASILLNSSISKLKALGYDTIAPTGNIYINRNVAYTRSRYVTLSLWATDADSGVASMKFSNGSSMWTEWIPYDHNDRFYDWDLANPTYGGGNGQGKRYVYAKFQDNDGNVSPLYRDSIIYDRTSPTGSIEVESRDRYAPRTASVWVILNLSATDNLSKVRWMKFQNANSQWTDWMSYETSKSWNITNATYGGDNAKGIKCVYVRFKDGAGNVSSMYRDCIIYK